MPVCHDCPTWKMLFSCVKVGEGLVSRAEPSTVDTFLLCVSWHIGVDQRTTYITCEEIVYKSL